MGTLWRSCEKVREAIKLSFGVVSGIGPGIGVLDKSMCPMEKGVKGFNFFSGALGFFCIGFNGIFELIRKRLYSTHA